MTLGPQTNRPDKQFRILAHQVCGVTRFLYSPLFLLRSESYKPRIPLGLLSSLHDLSRPQRRVGLGVHVVVDPSDNPHGTVGGPGGYVVSGRLVLCSCHWVVVTVEVPDPSRLEVRRPEGLRVGPLRRLRSGSVQNELGLSHPHRLT